ncbi:MAG: GDP-mannose 4,6-dehydratase [Alphaproteobacteria bacterium]
MRSYLVTGGCGFIGSHLADALIARRHRVRILDDLSTGLRANAPAEAELIVGDVADEPTVRRAMDGMDGCFHLAAIASVQKSVEAWRPTHRVNLGGTINVLEAAHESGGLPVVYASSAAVYGDDPALPLRETAPFRPNSPYGADKAACELRRMRRSPCAGCRAPACDSSTSTGRVRIRLALFGRYSIFADRLLTGKPLTIFGGGSRAISSSSATWWPLLLAMERQDKSARVFNVARGEAVSLLRLVAALERVAGRKASVRHAPPRAGDDRHSAGDARRIRDSLGFAAKVELEEGWPRFWAGCDPRRAPAPSRPSGQRLGIK